MNSEKIKIKSLLSKPGTYILFRYCVLGISLFTIHFSLFTAAAPAQSRDYLTSEEIELIRDAQQIDLRINVLTRAIDRRFQVLKIGTNAPPPPKKDPGEWGNLPTGTRTELLSDIDHILQKAIDDIDNLSERPDSMVVDPDDPDAKKHPKTYAALFPKAVKALAAAAERYQPALKAELDKTTDEHEKGLILGSLDKCAEITAAVAKLKN